MSLNCPETDCHHSGSGRSEAGILQIRVGFTQSEYPNKITINWILLDTCSTESFVNNLYIFGPVCNYTKYEILVVHKNDGSKNFTNITTLKILPLDIHMNEYTMKKTHH